MAHRVRSQNEDEGKIAKTKQSEERRRENSKTRNGLGILSNSTEHDSFKFVLFYQRFVSSSNNSTEEFFKERNRSQERERLDFVY